MVETLKGDEQLPWEGNNNTDIDAKLGVLARPALAMLSREPLMRPSMHDAHASFMNVMGAARVNWYSIVCFFVGEMQRVYEGEE